jgi:uncharacterized membrane protein YkgB
VQLSLSFEGKENVYAAAGGATTFSMNHFSNVTTVIVGIYVLLLLGYWDAGILGGHSFAFYSLFCLSFVFIYPRCLERYGIAYGIAWDKPPSFMPRSN